MSARDDLRETLVRAVQRLGPLASRVVLAGGCAPAAWDLSSAVADVRPTEDVDLIVDTRTLVAYYALIKVFKEVAGLKEHQSEGASICRHNLGDIIVDLMPTDPSILGFANSWYAKAFATAERRELAVGVAIRVITPLYFVATKLEALANRGAGDYMVSADLEDIVTAFMGVPGLAAALRSGREEVHEFIRTRLRALLAEAAFADAWCASGGPDERQQAVALVMLNELRTAVATSAGPIRVRVRIAGGELEFSVPRQALTWSETGSQDRARLQADVDLAARADPSSARLLQECWAPEPFSERLDYIPVTFLGCECVACLEALEGTVPCWTCETCLGEAQAPCTRCGRELRAFAWDGRVSSRNRARVGFLLTPSPRCQVHDHDTCPRRWRFATAASDGEVVHEAACGCECHRRESR